MSDEVSWLSLFSLILRMNVVKVKVISLKSALLSQLCQGTSRRHSATLFYLSA